MLHPGLPGYTQMAIDEALFSCMTSDNEPVLRFYTWQRPTLSLGFFQKYKKVVHEPFCVHNNIHVVRRITGGRAVLHHVEVTYAVIAPLNLEIFEDSSLQGTYQLIAKALDLALKRLGVESASVHLHSSGGNQSPRTGNAQCFVSVSRYELADGRRKMIGSAQKRARDRFLQHGSILLDFDPDLQRGCVLNPDPEILEKIAPLNKVAGQQLGFDQISARFSDAFQEIFQTELQGSGFTTQEQQLISALEAKYRNEDWTRNGCR
jgi:lipoate-protein ligase A